ncbi:hypothetical protein NIES2100_22970 [Calothrix sp. NIES-2100]|nr:hypothetical protein NIES2100_22970 [Calothrix sp. NIES-2100]
MSTDGVSSDSLEDIWGKIPQASSVIQKLKLPEHQVKQLRGSSLT